MSPSVKCQGSFEGATLRDYQRKKEAQAKEIQRSKGESKVSWRAYADHVIHALANKVVDAALLHASQVVIEDLAADNLKAFAGFIILVNDFFCVNDRLVTLKASFLKNIFKSELLCLKE